MDKELKSWLLLCVGIIGANNATADLSVDTSWPKQLPVNKYDPHNYYGNGQTTSFNNAMNSNSPITAAEQEAVDNMLPERETERYYLKAGINKSTSKISSIENKSTGATYIGKELYAKKSSKDITGGQIGAGYIFDEFRVDVEYMFRNNMNYNQVPLFKRAGGVGGYPNLTSKITGHHLIANVYYEFKDIYLFKPFVGASVGLGMNKAKSTFTNLIGNATETKSKSKIGVDYGAQIGARLRIAKTKFYASASYRYLILGKVRWANESNDLILKGKRIINGFSLDLIYLL